MITTDHALTAFLSYAHADEDHHRRLAEHLKKLEGDGLIDAWDDRAILAGEFWDDVIKSKITTAQIILLLVSQRFLESPYVREVEIPFAIKQQQTGEATLVCVILDECDWKQVLRQLSGPASLRHAGHEVAGPGFRIRRDRQRYRGTRARTANRHRRGGPQRSPASQPHDLPAYAFSGRRGELRSVPGVAEGLPAASFLFEQVTIPAAIVL